ncbi:SusC/RagA family TonB-linked outer membrane protein [Pedobacter foliorum]|uniref:SusC/RagA family TonB-linked outer membrane protein n=1 Tax=Pedobacter foliorum TaxID=2739058 RepID=UPI001563CD0A|nr:SusC/RagA family TonB-linked outer membrane protein [Pedobacter foliorum]NRF37952.1 SusC/RagA family TonB-linked outer membrane protein [Pedobacter foliorum]
MKTLIKIACFLFAVLMIPVSVMAQSVKTGKVIDQRGETVVGATIKVQGKNVGAVTDASGNFRLQLSVGDVLLCSYIGYLPVKIVYKRDADLTIRLNEDSKTLGDVLVVGYKSQSKTEITGSVASVKMDKITETQAAESFESLLQGRVAGVNIQLNSGEPGATPVIIIRGLAAVSRDDASQMSEPLYVVDGIPIISKTSSEFAVTSTNVLADLNPSDIEDVVVLKDASAAAIYGSRAANGVILITTKKGKTGKPQINLNIRTGVNIVPQLLDVAGGNKEREQVARLYNLYAPYGTFMPAMYTDVTNPFYHNSSDWQGYLYNTSITQDYNGSIRGAGDFGQYSISLGYMDNVGIKFNTGFKRYSTMASTTFNAFNKALIINNTLAVSRTDKTRPPGALGSNYSSLLPLPNNPAVKGAEVYESGNIADVNDRVRFSSDATLNITKDLSYKASLSMEYLRAMKDSVGESRRTLRVANRSAVGENRNLLFQNTVTYAPKFGDGHSLSILVGQSAEKLESKITKVSSVSSAQTLSQTVNWPNGGSIGSSDYTANTLMSYFSRMDYSYKQKYLVGASIRTDGSSKFGKANRWGVFPSVSAGWNFSKEKGLADLSWLTSGKIRGSYGLSGTTWDNDYLALGLMDGGQLDQYNSLIQITYGGMGGFTPTWKNGFKNENLTWVKTSMGNIGLDLSLFKNKIEFIFDAYEKLTKGLLLTTSLPTTSGYNEVYRNAANVLNRGLEFTLNTNMELGPSVTWSTGLNFAYNKNRVIALPDGNADIIKISTSGQDFGSIVRTGAPLNGFFFYESQGIYQAESQIPVNPKTGKRLIGLQNKALKVGDRNFKDQNGDYKIDVADRVYSGDPNPKWTGGWTNDLSYKGFSLNVVSTFVIGRDIVNNQLLDRLKLGKNFAGGSSLPNFDNYAIWEKSGDIAKYPTLNPWGDASQIINYDSEYVEDGSYFKIKSATLSYNFTKKLWKHLPFDRARVYCTMDNVVTFQKYSGPDAELVTIDGFDDSKGYPMRRMVLFGISLGL